MKQTFDAAQASAAGAVGLNPDESLSVAVNELFDVLAPGGTVVHSATSSDPLVQVSASSTTVTVTAVLVGSAAVRVAARVTGTSAAVPSKSGLGPSGDRFDVGSGEVVALEQQRQSSRAGQRVGEDIPEIEAGRMTSLAEAAAGLRRRRGLFSIDRLDHDERFVQEVPNALVEELIATRYRDQLDDRHRRDQDTTGAGDGGPKSRSIRLAPQNADERRGVDDDHLGNPCSS